MEISNPIELKLEEFGNILQAFVINPSGVPIACSDGNAIFHESRTIVGRLDHYLFEMDPSHVLFALYLEVCKWVKEWNAAQEKLKAIADSAR